tara:strand:+ start:2111 stop:2344 length:234 start_codon:yes stop_codon:yes gene_type:complete
MINQMNETVAVTLTKDEAFFIGIILGDAKREFEKRYEHFNEDKTKYPANAEDSFTRTFERIETIGRKVDYKDFRNYS